jgi:signal transduction histidine kinase
MEGFWPVVGALGALATGTVAGAIALRRVLRRARSLRTHFLAVTIGALMLAALAAMLLARLMVLKAGETRNVLGVLGITAIFAIVLVLIASGPLGSDARRVEAAVRSVEGGDRAVRTAVNRQDELGHVARAFDQLTSRLGELEAERASIDAERTALLSSIGHDLRTPLAAMQAALEALIDDVAPDRDRYLRSMQHDITALSALIDDLFLLARIESGRLELVRASVDLTELADEAVEALTPSAAAAQVQLVLDASESVRVLGNPVAVGRVIRNLVDNAVRHAPPGSAVRIVIDASGVPTIRVVDDGPGFPAAFVEQAFDRFTRADSSRTRATGGTGLGLAIARGLVETLGGRIWIEPPPGGRVAFELPRAS